MSEFTEISIILGLAAFLAVIASKLKQPPILGFIFAGLILGPIMALRLHTDSIELFSKIGIAFLLFVVGLELNISDLKNVGKVTLLAGIGQVTLASIIGFTVSFLLGFNLITSLYIGFALTFSSTIVIIKLLSLRKELDTLHGKISVGILLIQDLVAVLALIGISTFSNLNGTQILFEVVFVILKMIGILSVVYVFVEYILPFVLKIVSRDQETLFIFVVAYALMLAAIVGSPIIGFSIEIGALLAGISLAAFYEHSQIESWMKPLRDFFLVLFFVLLGLNISIGSLNEVLIPSIVLTLVVLIGNPLIIMTIMSLLGYHKRVGFLTSLSFGQVSEFSLLLITLGVTKGHIPANTQTIITIVGAATMAISSYAISFNDDIYEKLKSVLNIFHFKKKVIYGHNKKPEHKDHIILVGCDRIGGNILNSLLKKNEKVLIVDFNAKNVESLMERNIPVLFGDIRDADIYNALNLEEAKYLISTISNIKANRALMKHINTLSKQPLTIMVAKDEKEVLELYDLGAHFVVYPYFLTGQNIGQIMKSAEKENYMENYKNRYFGGMLAVLHSDP